MFSSIVEQIWNGPPYICSFNFYWSIPGLFSFIFGNFQQRVQLSQQFNVKNAQLVFRKIKINDNLIKSLLP